MTVSERIGLDLGTLRDAPSLASAASEAGARVVRLRFDLGDRTVVDASLLSEAEAAVDALRAAGLRVLGVADGDLTVAPGGAGAFGEEAPESIARAWAEEMAGNAASLASALGDRVMAWEVLPEPNRREGNGPRIAPSRWATLLDIVLREIARAVPGATRVAGGLVSDDEDDGVDYLRAALRRAPWPIADPPYQALGISLRVLADGGPSEGIVAATIEERAARLERAAAQGGEAPPLWVTSVGWDAVRAGESAQARNLWTAFDTLTARPEIHGVLWAALVDGGDSRGLFVGARPEEDARRPAWQAFKDFVLYAAQISPAASPLSEAEASADASVPADEMRAADQEMTAAGLTAAAADEAMEQGRDEGSDEAPSDAAADMGEPEDVEEDVVEGVLDDVVDDVVIEGSAVLVERDEAREPEPPDVLFSEYGGTEAPPPAPEETADTASPIEEGETTPPAEAEEDGAPASEGGPSGAAAAAAAVGAAFVAAQRGDEEEDETAADAGSAAEIEEAADAETDAETLEAAPDTGPAVAAIDAAAAQAEDPADARAEVASEADAESEADAPDLAPPDEDPREQEEEGPDAPAAPGAGLAAAAGLGAAVAAGRAATRPDGEPEEGPLETTDPAAGAEAAAAIGDEPETAVDAADEGETRATRGAAAAAGVAAAGLGAERAPRIVVLRVPSTEELLRAQGLDDEVLDGALAALEARYGRREGLPAGEYVVGLGARERPAEGAARPSNQDVLGAFYRAGGGSWALLAKAGIPLRDLVLDREAPYQGPALGGLPGLERAEREAILAALA